MANRTPNEIRAEFKRKGISISQWCLSHNLSVLLVYQLLSGRRNPQRGESHRAAVLLGMKDGEVVRPDQVASTFQTSIKRAG